MKVYTRIVIDMNSGLTRLREGYFVSDDAPVDRCGGGPSQSQKDAATAQANLSTTEAKNGADALALQKQVYGQISPFATKLMANGSPYYAAQMDYAGGNAARAAAPGRAQLMRSLATQGSLPSGFATSQLADYNEGVGQNYDQGLQTAENNNENLKLQGANILAGQQGVFNPANANSTAASANSSIMNAPLQTPSPWSTIAGAGAGIGSALIKKY